MVFSIQIAAVTTRPHMVVGTHFFIPAYYMKLLEIVRGQQTSATSIATAVHLAKLIGKVEDIFFYSNQSHTSYNIGLHKSGSKLRENKIVKVGEYKEGRLKY